MLINWKTKRAFRRIFSAFIPNRKFRHILVGTGLYGFYSYFIRLFNYKKEPKKFKYQLSFVLIVKNAACYMDEWINYHKLVGVDHFYIYDNESTDNLKEVLKPYIKSGLVEYRYWKGKSEQLRCYNYALNKHRKETKWLGFIDDDEFVVPVKDKTIPDVLKRLGIKSSLSIAWVLYGSNKQKKKKDGLVIERFTKRAKKAFRQYKVIVNPRIAVAITSAHKCACLGKNYSVTENLENVDLTKNHTENIIRVNHYHVKSLEEFLLKKNRGDVLYIKHNANTERFNYLDKISSDINDDIMEKYVPKVKKMIEKVRK